MQLNAKQVIAICLAILSVFSGSTAQLTDLFGSGVAKLMISFSSLAATTLSSVMAVLTSTTQTVKDVGALQGVEVQVSRSATPQIAAMAVAPTDNGIAPAPGEDTAVAKVAEGAAA